jgi:predicted permease
MFPNLKLAVRQLVKSPAFTLVAIGSLALGIGASTAVFSLVNAVLLRSLPVPNPHELRALQWTGLDSRIPSLNGQVEREGNRTTAESVHHPMFLDIRRELAPMANIFGYRPLPEVVARAAGEPFVGNGWLVSDNFFAALGVTPLAGRVFTPTSVSSDSGHGVIIAYAWWERHFSRAAEAIGQPLVINGHSFTVLGVLPRDFPGLNPAEPPEFYVLMQEGFPLLSQTLNRETHWNIRMMARLKPATSDEQFNAAMNVVFARIAGPALKEPSILVESGHGGLTVYRKAYGKPLLLLLAIVALVMLVACANLAGLSLARSAGRRHDICVRSALGAGRWRLLRESLTESVLVALVGGGLGVLIALWARGALVGLLSGSTEGFHYDLSLDLTVLAFSLGAALLTAVLSGLLPALYAARANPLDGLRSRTSLGAPRLRIGKSLVAAQIALSVVLLTGAGLYVRTLLNLRNIDPGFDTEKLLLFEASPSGAGYAGERLTAYYERVLETAAALPGVEGTTIMQTPLLGDSIWSSWFALPGETLEESKKLTNRLAVNENFFATMGIPLLRGRGIRPADSAQAAKVLVVNETFVRKFFPHEDPIGRSITLHNGAWQIIGVCGDAKYEHIKASIPPTTYMPFRQEIINSTAVFAVRTSLPPGTLANAVRGAFASIDRNVPISRITTQSELRNRNLSDEEMLATLCTALAGLALLLSCIGLYGLMAYHVARRAGEIGLRMAIGAQPSDIAGGILREASLLALAGVALGVPAALGASHLIKSQLYEVGSGDPLTLAGVVALLVAVTLLAAWLPARRAARVDPMSALRAE